MEQHYHQLLCAARSPLRGNMSSRLHRTHSSICVGQSFVTLPSFGCQRTPTMPLSLSPTPAVSGWRREVRYTLCPHIPSCRGASPTGRIPPSPQILLIPHSQAGSTGGWAEMACRGGMQDGETPPDPREENGILLCLLGDKASLRSQSFPGNTFPSLGCQVFTSPLGGEGRRSS